MTMMSSVRAIHGVDPAEEIRSRIGNLDDIEIMNNNILVAIYQRPDSIALGGGHKLYLSVDKPKEDLYQGKVGLVLKLGPLAYVDDDSTRFFGQCLKPGDWVAFWPSDGRRIEINGVHCRIFIESGIPMKIPRPDAVY